MLWKKYAILLFLMPAAASAYVRTLSDGGQPLYWASPSVAMVVNPVNSSGLSEGQIGTMIGQAFSAWSVVPGTRAGASVSVSSSYPPVSAPDGQNTIAFASRAGRQMDWGVIAVTEVFYHLNDGSIASADMTFNDNQFLFTSHEGDTGKNIGGRTAIYLRDVATHEAGHVFGLDHSTVNLSSMIYTAFGGQYSLGGDDKSGILTAYPAGGARGAIQGVVAGLNGGIFGAHVTAINLATGKVEAGALAGPNGSVRIGDIPPGKYAVMMEPLGTSTSSISGFYQNVNHRFCGGSSFRRRFYGACGSSQAGVVEVRDGESSDLGVLAPSCSGMGNPQGAPTSLASAREIGHEGGAVYGTLRPGDTHYYRMSGLNGSLAAKAIAYALYSPVDVRVRILAADGSPVDGATSADNGDPLPGGYTNYDSSANAADLHGTYVIAVSAGASRIPAANYSAGYDLLDRDGHYLLAFSVNGELANSSADMSGCISVNNTQQSATVRAPASSSRDDGKKAAGCGSLDSGDPGRPLSGGLAQMLLSVALIQLFVWTLLRGREAALVRRGR